MFSRRPSFLVQTFAGSQPVTAWLSPVQQSPGPNAHWRVWLCATTTQISDVQAPDFVCSETTVDRA